MKLQVTARHQSPVRVSGPKSAPISAVIRWKGDMIPKFGCSNHHNKYKDVEVHQVGVAIKPLRE